MQDNNDTPIVQHYTTTYTPPLYNILVQKHASGVYYHAGQIVTTSQTSPFDLYHEFQLQNLNLWIYELSISGSYCEFYLKSFEVSWDIADKKHKHYLSNSWHLRPQPLAPRQLELVRERIHIRIIAFISYIYSTWKYVSFKEKCISWSFSLQSHALFHDIFLQRSV